LFQPNAEVATSSKKKAIETGVQNAKGELVVVTDADCIPTNEWLHTIASFYQKTQAVFIAAPVQLRTYPTLLSVFQSLDFITLQGITAASVTANSHSMCNGANLAYLRSAFLEVDGFSGIDKLASGDDMLLMYKIWKKHPRKIYYLKNEKAIIETEPMTTWKDFFQQRIRWSSKATYYKDWRISLVLLFVYLFNCLFFVLLLAAIFNGYYWLVLFFYLAGKILIELPFVYSVARFYKKQNLVFYFPFLQPLHIIYTVVIGLVSQFGTYSWKGRVTK
jgi:cellulose synthase/poly-beta-1,6-N-acetylglucosamine synthase-like glycosyltransferase